MDQSGGVSPTYIFEALPKDDVVWEVAIPDFGDAILYHQAVVSQVLGDAVPHLNLDRLATLVSRFRLEGRGGSGHTQGYMRNAA